MLGSVVSRSGCHRSWGRRRPTTRAEQKKLEEEEMQERRRGSEPSLLVVPPPRLRSTAPLRPHFGPHQKVRRVEEELGDVEEEEEEEEKEEGMEASTSTCRWWFKDPGTVREDNQRVGYVEEAEGGREEQVAGSLLAPDLSPSPRLEGTMLRFSHMCLRVVSPSPLEGSPVPTCLCVASPSSMALCAGSPLPLCQCVGSPLPTAMCASCPLPFSSSIGSSVVASVWCLLVCSRSGRVVSRRSLSWLVPFGKVLVPSRRHVARLTVFREALVDADGVPGTQNPEVRLWWWADGVEATCDLLSCSHLLERRR